MLASSLLLAAVLRMSASAPATCSTGVDAKGPQLFLEAVKPAIADTLVSMHLCLVPSKVGLGSYSVALAFDSLTMRATRVDVSGGMQVANANVAGVVRIAGAAPGGFQRGVMATIAFRVKRGKALSSVRLTLMEATSTTGMSVLGSARVAGYPPTDRTQGIVQMTQTPELRAMTHEAARLPAPRVDSISPRSGEIDAESVLDLVLYGKGFAAAGNTVLFDAASVDSLTSESGGTIIRFMAPTMIPAHGSVQAHRVAPGKYAVKVRTPGGTSNAVTFTVRGDDR